MNVAFNNITNLSFTKENRFFGDGIARYRSLKNYSIEGVLHSGQAIDNDTITAFPKITGYYNNDNFDTVSINGTSLGKGKITSVNVPRGDHIKRGLYTVNFTVYDTGDLSIWAGDPNYAGLTTINSSELLEDFSETFNFNTSNNNTFSYEHSLNIRYLEDTSSAITLAKNLANTIFSASLPFPFLSDPTIASDYDTAGKKYYTETFNLITKSCSFTKKFEILNTPQTNYSNEFKHSITIDPDGNINVSENGRIKIKTTPFTSYIDGAISTVMGGAYSRCNTVFTNILAGANAELGSSDPLIITPVQQGRTINKLAGEIEYTVNFTNNKYFYSKSSFFGTHDFTVSLDKNQEEIVTVNENGSFTINRSEIENVNKTNVINLAQTLMSDAATRCSNLYSIIPNGTTLKELGRNIDFKNNFKILNYTINYSDDPTILSSNPNFTRISYEMGVDKSKHIYQKYRIPNIKPFSSAVGSEYLYAGDQSDLGNFYINVRAVAKRGAAENTINDTISNLITTTNFNALVNSYTAAKRLTTFTYSSQGTPENYLSNCTFTIDSERNIGINLSNAYVGVVPRYAGNL